MKLLLLLCALVSAIPSRPVRVDAQCTIGFQPVPTVSHGPCPVISRHRLKAYSTLLADPHRTIQFLSEQHFVSAESFDTGLHDSFAPGQSGSTRNVP
jgi:hypothetical protein